MSEGTAGSNCAHSPPRARRPRTRERLLRYQIWRPSVFVVYSPTDRDFFLRPELGYKLTENLSFTFGANRFGGATATTFFGQFKKDNNLFLNVRFDF